MAKVVFPFDHFDIDTPEEFRKRTEQAGICVPVSDDLSALGRTHSVGGKLIFNSMAIQPLEGLDAEENGAPGSLTFARYEKLAAQGAGMLWIEATAFSEDGRDSIRQLWINEETLPEFRHLAQRIDRAAHAAGHRPPYKILQLTHSGRCSRDRNGRPAPLAAFENPYLDRLMGPAKIVTDDYLDAMMYQLTDAAVLAYEAGFEAIDLKLCHQYLMKELLCAYKREGKYGGSQENRFRFAVETVGHIQARLGSSLGIAVRLNAYDGIPWPYGWGMKQQEGVFETDLTEVKELMRQLHRKGVQIFNISTTSPRFSPCGNGYLDNFVDDAQTDPFRGVADLLHATKELRQSLPRDICFVGTGLSWFGPFSANIGAGCIEHGWFDAAGFGRSVMTDNDFIPSVLEGKQPDRKKACRGCDSCFRLFYADLPTGCPVYHKAWEELYRAASEKGLISGSVIY
ncbi:MAG: NADH:flavin oxidoreductase [Firmicutes bacterium]|nr:NADH:flavin oxidoreductase [Bacillota bacterium]